MYRWLPCVLLVLAPLAQAGGLRGIVIDPSPAGHERQFSGWRYDAPVPAQQQVGLELGDDVAGTTLRLLPADAADGQYRVSVQFETSMALSGEGPHLDFTDWKHCRSGWRPARHLRDLAFVLPVPAEHESTCFPPTTTDEIVAETRRVLVRDGMASDGAHWLALARSVRVPGELPSYVGISKVRVRIEQRDGDAWRVIHTIDFLPPMGC